MLNFFDFLVESIEVFLGILGGIIEGLVNAFLILFNSIGYVTQLTFYLPSVVSGFALCVLSVGIIKFVIGR